MLASSSTNRQLPFLLLAKSSRGAAAADLVHKILEAPGLCTFGEFMKIPSIQQLQESHAPVHRLLRLFAYGTLIDYKQHESELPPLTEAMLRKLRLLTIMSLAGATRELPYSDLLRALDLPADGLRALEDLVIDGISMDLFHGTLDQRARTLRLTTVAGRDVDARGLDETVAVLRGWCDAADRTVAEVEARIAHVREVAASAGGAQETEHHSLVAAKDSKRVKRTAGGAGGAGVPMYA